MFELNELVLHLVQADVSVFLRKSFMRRNVSRDPEFHIATYQGGFFLHATLKDTHNWCGYTRVVKVPDFIEIDKLVVFLLSNEWEETAPIDVL